MRPKLPSLRALLCAALALVACHPRQSQNSPATLSPADHLKVIERIVTETGTRPNKAGLSEIRLHLAAVKPVLSTDYHRTKLDDIDYWSEIFFAHAPAYPAESKDLTDWILSACHAVEDGLPRAQ
jgi:hypothetical protein